MTSPSTLSRKAAKTKNPKEAKRLRAEAAKMRRLARAKADIKHARDLGKVLGKEMPERPATLFEHNSAPQSDGTAGWAAVRPPEGILDSEIDELRKLARQKSPEFAQTVRLLRLVAHSEGRRITDEANTKQMKTIREINNINVVCAFIAEMNGIMALNKGPLPPVIMVAGFTLARVLDALRDAGYTTEGKTGMQRR